MKVFVSTHPFGANNDAPIDLLKKNNIDVSLNPYGRKITREELIENIKDVDGLIAGTEKIDKEVLAHAPNLKIISRVGIGLDSISFKDVLDRNILLTYTPEAVTRAVAELTLANMLNLARSIININNDLKEGRWNRIIGYELSTLTIGIIGFGRVGRTVAKLLRGFDCRILANDLAPDDEIGSYYDITFCKKEEIYKNADIITLHVPKTPLTDNMITLREMQLMKRTASLINTSRGGIINEDDLFEALKEGEIASAAIDVYNKEPYEGPLAGLENIILTSHSGSCSTRARHLMEFTAASEIEKFVNGHPPIFPVPDELIHFERNKKYVPINSDWREVSSFNLESNSDEFYQLYRRRWRQYPTNSFVGPTPLNIDIELMKSNADTPNTSELTLSQTQLDSVFMSHSVYSSIINEIKNFNEPVAIKFGFRGDPLYHPQVIPFVRMAKEAGAVETIISTYGWSLNMASVEGLIDAGLDVLNIFLEEECYHPEDKGANITKIHKICKILNIIREQRALKNVLLPKIRLVIRQDPFVDNDISRYKRYWRIWTDNITLCDKEDLNLKPSSNEKPWSCSKLWQRMAIAHDGTFLMCHHDINEKYKLGQFPEQSIHSTWTGKSFEEMRKSHLANKAHQIEPCKSCIHRLTEYKKI